MLMPKFSQGDLLPEKNIDKDEYNIIENDIGHCDNSFQLGSFGGSSEVDIIISQTRIEPKNIVDDTLVTTGTFHK